MLPRFSCLALAGAFDGVGHTTALLDCSMDRAVRCCLLRLLESLLAPDSSPQDDKAARVAAANGRAFVEAGGVQLAVDLVAGQLTALLCVCPLNEPEKAVRQAERCRVQAHTEAQGQGTSFKQAKLQDWMDAGWVHVLRELLRQRSPV